MGQEIEIKLELAQSDQRRFMRHPLLQTAIKRTDQILDNAYFDTPQLELRKHGIALRIRRQGRRRLQTVKLAGKAVNGLSSRPEWEVPYVGRFDFSCIEVAEVKAWLERPEIFNEIEPLFRTKFRRITWHLPLAAGGEVLVALDRGEVSVADRSVAISEVELELYNSNDLQALNAVSDTLRQRIPLVPSNVSKSERAYELMKTVTLASR